MVDEILHRKLKIGQPKAHCKFQIGKRCPAPLVAPVVLLLNDRTIILYGNCFEYESPTKKDESNIVFTRKSQRTPQHETKNVKTCH
jgi:hypothetical protein